MKTLSQQLKILSIYLCCALIFTAPLWAEATLNTTEQQKEPTSFKKNESLSLKKKGNILNIILDRTPEISTRRGTLVIEAFIDTNNNKIWDPDELNLKDEIVCSLNKIRYATPAFIPALDYNARYKISCVGSNHFQPTIDQKNVLIARRGQIINMAIPCRSITP